MWWRKSLKHKVKLMLKKLLLISAILFASASLANAQGGPVLSSGIVVLGSTGRPVSGATVTFCTSGATGVPCSPTVTVYSDVGLSMPTSNPQKTDGNGNVSVYAPAGNYTYTVTGQGVSLVGQPFTAVVASSSGTITGTILVNQVSFGLGGSSLTGSNNFQYVPANGGLLITTSNVGPTNVTGSGLTFTNSGGGGTTYFVKDASGAFTIRHDSTPVSSHGFLTWDASGDLLLSGAGNSPLLSFYPSGSVAPWGVGSAILAINQTGAGTHVFAITNTGIGSGAMAFDIYNGLFTMYGNTSGQAGIGINAVAGTPCNLILPTISALAGQSLTSAAASGGNCQAAWTNSPLAASLVTTAATTDNVTVTGMTSSGHCSLTPTNAAASALAAVPYVSAKTTNQITVTHSVTASANFDVLCTPY